MNNILNFDVLKKEIETKNNTLKLNGLTEEFDYIRDLRMYDDKYDEDIIEWALEIVAQKGSILQNPIEKIEEFAISYNGIFSLLKRDEDFKKLTELFVLLNPEYKKDREIVFNLLKQLSEFIADSVFASSLGEKILDIFILEVYNICDINILMAAADWLNYYNGWILDAIPFSPYFDPNPYNEELFNLDEFINLMPEKFKSINNYRELTKIILSLTWAINYDPFNETIYAVLLRDYKLQLEGRPIDKSQYKRTLITKDIGINNIKFVFSVDERMKNLAEVVIFEGIKKCKYIDDYYNIGIFEDIYDDIMADLHLEELKLNSLIKEVNL